MNTIIKASESNDHPQIPAGVSHKVLSRPAGDCPYFLLKVSEADVQAHDLSGDVVTDTAAFYSQYELSDGDDEE